MKFKDLDAAQKGRFRLTFFIYVLIGIVVLSIFCSSLLSEKQHAGDDWYSYFQDVPEQQELVRQLSAEATEVSVGTYVENIRELNLKASYFRVEFMLWFNWEGDADINPAENFRVYKGLINKMTVLDESHENGRHYQLLSVDASVSKHYDTKRFPLESHQLRFYVESTAPVQEVVFRADADNSGINENISLSGYKFWRHGVGVVSYTYESNHGNPDIRGDEITSELVTAVEINRANLGMYFKCFVALVGTITWVLIALFICTYHHVDPLGMVPAALFGTVSNILVGANLVPDAMDMGLIEYVNLWGVLTVLGGAIAIISINKVRREEKDKSKIFAHYYGRMLFYTLLTFAVAGQIILPMCAYIW